MREVRAPVLDCRVAPMSTFPAASPLPIDGGSLDLDGLEAVARRGRPVVLAPAARDAVRASRHVVDDAVARGAVVYGVTTGFGNFADVHVPLDRLRELQLNLLRSHAAGVGAPLGAEETRALCSCARTCSPRASPASGSRPSSSSCELLNRRVHPVVPSQGSVGASGDLAPLAHLALVLIGEGECVFDGAPALGRRRPPRAPASRPLVLEPKEGLALINGTQLMTAVGGLALAEARRLARSADVVGRPDPRRPRGHRRAPSTRASTPRGRTPARRPPPRNLRACSTAAPSASRTATAGKVQDAYSLRCMPQVHGAARDALDYVTPRARPSR